MTRGTIGRVGALAALLVVTGGVLAFAADDPGNERRAAECRAVDYDTVGCTFTHAGEGHAAPGGGAPATTPTTSPSADGMRPAPDPNLVSTWEVRRDASGRQCWVPTGGSYETDPARRAQLQREADRAYLAQSGGAELPPCHADVAQPATTTAAATAPGFFREADIRERLGSPNPRIEPGRAISGKTAYLEIGGAGARTFPLADPLGGPGVTVDARPTYRVEWGDGSTTETSSTGGPWPRGDVTHVYQRAGRYDVVVTARWTARWTTANGETGEFTGLQTEGRIPRFPVTEVQAVRER